MLEFARLRFDLSVTGTLLTEEREHPELLEAARRQMIVPAIDRFRQVLRAGIERGELRADLDLDAAAHALLGSFFIHYLERGRPGPPLGRGHRRHPLACVRCPARLTAAVHTSRDAGG